MPFIKNKYYRWYVSLISISDSGDYIESHHILPRCMGGRHGKNNIVRLSFRHHFLAHWLLTKCTSGIHQRKMLHALSAMRHHPWTPGRIITAWQFDIVKRANRISRIGIPSPNKGKSPTQETRAKMSAAKIGRQASIETREKMSIAKKGEKFPERKFDPIYKAKMSTAKIGKTHKSSPRSENSKLLMSMAHHSTTRAKSNNKSTGLKGVCRISAHIWQAQIMVGNKRYYLGRFDCPAAARMVYIVKSSMLSRSR